MKVKIDTKAHFKVFTVSGTELHANMAEELGSGLRRAAATAPGHLILVVEPPAAAREAVATVLTGVAREMAARNLSFVITGILPVDAAVPRSAPGLSIVPTYQEAVDMVMMEEMERELGAWGDPAEEAPGS